ncbi:hypothetical protein HanIR_Chr17g0897801 [Helianthus annuus]|nr:hypothetical protein HanIR_Chr17g0897801 [Helianthus annuus]
MYRVNPPPPLSQLGGLTPNPPSRYSSWFLPSSPNFPSRGGYERTSMPPEHQTPILFHHSVTITTREQSQQHTRLLKRVRAKMNRFKPGRVKPSLPLSQRFMPFNSVHTFTCNHVTDLFPQIHL